MAYFFSFAVGPCTGGGRFVAILTSLRDKGSNKGEKQIVESNVSV